MKVRSKLAGLKQDLDVISIRKLLLVLTQRRS